MIDLLDVPPVLWSAEDCERAAVEIRDCRKAVEALRTLHRAAELDLVGLADFVEITTRTALTELDMRT